MMENITLGRYYPGTSLLHRLDPRLKIVMTIAMMVVIFLIKKPVPLVLLTLLITLAIVSSRIPAKQIFNSIRPILFVILFASVLNLFTVDGNVWFQIGPLRVTDAAVETAGRMSLRLLMLILTTSVFLTLTTTPILVADAMESLMKPLNRVRFPVHELAMMMSIALRFVPTLAEETSKIMKAQSSRGADYDTGGILKKAKGLVSVLVPLFISAFRRAEDLAVAMEARCYHGGKGRTKLKVMRISPTDIQTAIGFSVFVSLLLILQFSSILS